MRPHARTARAALLVIAGSLAQGPLGAQVIEGRVFDHDLGTPLAGVQITLLHPDDRVLATQLSDDDGRFRVTAPEPGPWRIRADLLGHGSALSDSLHLGPDQVVRVEIQLSVHPIEIDDPIVVIGEAPHRSADIEAFHEQRARGERTGFGHFIHGDQLQRGGRPSDLLRMVPGVTVTTRDGARGRQIRMRGGCVPDIYIDGIQINGFSDAESLDSYVDVQSIEGIEVYRGAQQPGGRFHDRSGCGLVLVWTRRGQYDPAASVSWVKITIGLSLLLALFLIR